MELRQRLNKLVCQSEFVFNAALKLLYMIFALLCAVTLVVFAAILFYGAIIMVLSV